MTEPGNKYQQWIIRLLNCWLYMLIRTLKLSTSIIIFGLSAKVMTLNNTQRPLCIIQFKWIYLSRAWWSSFCIVFFCRLIILQIWITSGINWTEACDASNDFAIKQLLHKKIKQHPECRHLLHKKFMMVYPFYKCFLKVHTDTWTVHIENNDEYFTVYMF